MKIRNSRDLGLLLRENRRKRGWSQTDLASRIGTSRHWIMEMEGGKATVELGLVLRAISALNLTCDIQESIALRPSSPEPARSRQVAIDLADVLANARGRELVAPGQAKTSSAAETGRGTPRGKKRKQ